MKKIISQLFFVLCIMINSYLNADEINGNDIELSESINNEYPAICMKRDYFIEYRMAAFVPRSRRFRDVYCEAGCSYQIETSSSIYKCLYGWLNFDWFSKHGHSSFHESSRINIANTSFGVKSLYVFDDHFTGYVGMGVCFANVNIKNKLIHGREHSNKLACGGVFKSGFYFFITPRIYVDTFFDYFYQPIHFRTTRDVGGLKLGSSIGIKF